MVLDLGMFELTKNLRLKNEHFLQIQLAIRIRACYNSEE